MPACWVVSVTISCCIVGSAESWSKVRNVPPTCFRTTETVSTRGVAAVWEVEGLRGVLFFEAIFYGFFVRFGNVTLSTESQKVAGLKPRLPRRVLRPWTTLCTVYYTDDYSYQRYVRTNVLDITWMKGCDTCETIFRFCCHNQIISYVNKTHCDFFWFCEFWVESEISKWWHLRG